MRHKLPVGFVCAFTLFALMVSAPSEAQLAAPGPSGVVFGHVHVAGRDLDAHRRFWTLLGATATKNGTLEMMQFPGGYVNLRQGDTSGGSVGSSINHFGFHVKNIKESLAKWQAAGVKMEPETIPTQRFLIGPDDVRVEIIENQAISVPIQFHHVHLFVDDPLAAQAFYVRTFGAVAGKRLTLDTATLPGIELTFSKSPMPTVKTQGRSIDHIGFEVKNLEVFLNKLKAGGMKLDRDYQRSQAASLMLSNITDPFGTYIEMTEGLVPGTWK